MMQMAPKDKSEVPANAAILNEIDRLADLAAGAGYRAKFLVDDLCFAFERTRGTQDDGELTLRFRADNIDATEWLASELWGSIKELQGKLDALGRRLAGGANAA
jgi:hypothetical protein